MDTKIGFIGTGNMNSALIKSISSSKIKPERINIFDRNLQKLERLKESTGVNIKNSISDLVTDSDIIILGVKPKDVKTTLESIKDLFDSKKILVSVAVGLPISMYEGVLGVDKKIVRTMPNTPALVGEGMTVMSPNNLLTQEEISFICDIFTSCGKVELMSETLMTEVASVTGSSPAYIFMLIEAMADGAVLQGFPRDQALRLVSQAVLGAAKMVQETNIHPGQLKDQVCSPGGTTIEAVRHLEKTGFRSSLIEAMLACTNKAKEIEKKSN